LGEITLFEQKLDWRKHKFHQYKKQTIKKALNVLQHSGLSRKLWVRSYLMLRASNNEDHKVWRPL
jgi:hypothetical protein